jgi:hypothetical protein
MATKKDAESAVVELAADSRDDIAGKPKMVISAGRGKVGKSVFMRWAIERNLAAGGEPVILDADRTNATLAAFFPTAKQPPSAEDEDVWLWLNAQTDTQIEKGTTLYLDLGGGDLTLKRWARDLDLAPFLSKHGIAPVLLHVLGSDVDDLAYLRDLETVFAPKHTVVVLNEGMVPAGRSAGSAFNPVFEDAVFRAASDRGAQVIRMPRLGCMQDVDRRRLSFQDAEAGAVKPGQERIGPTMRQMIALWRRGMEERFAPVATWIN